jgi:hypothetical protein
MVEFQPRWLTIARLPTAENTSAADIFKLSVP